uniref:Uncharacterized protein n=1 Tax=viral metagenome TaxID=1070528 RepID=A0A6M3J2F5_9ZZZZ
MPEDKSDILRKEVDRYIELHAGETFDLDIICRHLNVVSREGRHTVVKKLSYLVNDAKKLEKSNRIYRVIDNNINTIDLNTPPTPLDIAWPCDDKGNSFGLDKAKIFRKATITLAGEKDNYKTAFCLNFLAMNMDIHHCIYHTIEMSAEELVEKLQKFSWIDWQNPDGTWKFLAVETFDNWQDKIKQYPDSIHIIDFLDPGENAYNIGTIIKHIRERLQNGIALIAIQKKQSTGTRRDGTTYRNEIDYGIGGQFSEHIARVVLHLSNKNEMYVKVVKSFKGNDNPSGKRYKFYTTHNGTKFHNIQELVKPNEFELPPEAFR